MGSERYCLRWNNHQNNLLSVFSQLLHDELLVDVTLACEGHSLRAHKVILSACSTFFQELFVRHPDEHPIVILKDVKFGELRTLLEFMYKGEVSVEYEQLSTLMHTAETLRVKGLADMGASMDANIHRLRSPSRSRSRSPPDQPLDLGTPKWPASPPSPKQMLPPVQAEHRDSLPTSDSEPEDIDREGSNPHQMPTEPPGGLTSPHSDPKPGPSGLMPVQQAPLSLKKEMDWGERSSTGDEKSSPTEGSADFKSFSQSDITSPEVMLIEGSFGSPPHFATTSPSPFPFKREPLEQQHPSLAHLLQSERLRSECDSARCNSCFGHAACASRPVEAAAAEKPFKCEQCGQSYKYQSAFAKHREQNHTARLPGEKPFRCEICGMQFRYLKSFKKHRLNHAVERLHTTRQEPPEELDEPEAGKKDDGADVAAAVAADDHVTSSNEALGQDSNAAALDSLALALALASTAPAAPNGPHAPPPRGSPRPPDEQQLVKRFSCVFCQKAFRSKENLKLHVRKHTGERPFECEFCGRAFGGKSDMNRHLRIHTGERPYHCEVCGKCFARADYLSKHLTTHLHN